MSNTGNGARPSRDIGARLRQARKRAGLTGTQLGEKIGVTAQAISQVEVGKYQPTLAHIQTVAALSGYDLRWIITGKEPPSGGAVIEGDDVPFLTPDDLKNLEKSIPLATRRFRCTEPVGPRAFAIEVFDKSNDPHLQLGDVCVFDPAVSVEPGKFVVALIGSDLDPVIRILHERENGTLLMPANPAWAQKIIQSPDDGRILAPLVQFTRSIR